MKTLVITQHQGYVEYLLEEGTIKDGDYDVIPHATPEDCRGRRVLTSGLPLHLGALCESLTTVPLYLPASLRGVELTSDDVRKYAQKAVTYKVQVIG